MWAFYEWRLYKHYIPILSMLYKMHWLSKSYINCSSSVLKWVTGATIRLADQYEFAIWIHVSNINIILMRVKKTLDMIMLYVEVQFPPINWNANFPNGSQRSSLIDSHQNKSLSNYSSKDIKTYNNFIIFNVRCMHSSYHEKKKRRQIGH